MKRILGLDLGVASIGWAVVDEAEKENEQSSIIKAGVRVNPLTDKEQENFKKEETITTNAKRTEKRAARRNLQRYKQRRNVLINLLKKNNFITSNSILCENGKDSTFQTWQTRAKAVTEKISLEELAKVLLMINKKRGYKSSRNINNSSDEGELIDGMDVAIKLYKNNLTPGQYVLNLLNKGSKKSPDFYSSDLKKEFIRIYNYQKQFYPDILTDKFLEIIIDKSKKDTLEIFYGKYNIENSVEFKGKDKKLQEYKLRVKALNEQLTENEIVFVLTKIKEELNSSSKYLAAISDRSKELYISKQTIGQYLYNQLKNNPNTSLKNKVFYRQDYIDEFEKIWEKQKTFHSELTDELKQKIKDTIIFYQRRLKSQKGLLSYCEFESKKIEVEIAGKKIIKTTGSKVCPKSSPLFQEFKIWQTINNIIVIDEFCKEKALEQKEKEVLFKELNKKKVMKSPAIIKLLFKDNKQLKLNYEEIKGNTTFAKLIKACPSIKNNKDFVFDSSVVLDEQKLYKLWHLLYSYEGDNSNTGDESLITKLQIKFGFSEDEARNLSKVKFEKDYGNLSAKAILNILPYLEQGYIYSDACEKAGYRHSKESLTKEEIENKILAEHLEILPKNSLRNPVVEKILNQMVNVVNLLVDEYGKEDKNKEKHFDEIRIELARELKSSAKERENSTKQISETTKENEQIREQIKKDFHFNFVSRNDIIRYKLYQELKSNGYKTLYSNTYIPYKKIFSKDYEIEHIIPQALLFDDSFSNKTLESHAVNNKKGNTTAYDFVCNEYGNSEKEIKDYATRVKDNTDLSEAKKKKLLMKKEEIPQDFIQRDLRDSQYIAKKARQLLNGITKQVTSTSGRITSKLRRDWQIEQIMRELNWDKYDKAGLTKIKNKINKKAKTYDKKYEINNQTKKEIKGWTKRNDHRHHAMDAITIAFTKPSLIQHINNKAAQSNESSSIYEIMKDGKYRPPFAIKKFRNEVKQQLSEILVSIKAKNKVVTKNINTTKKIGGNTKKIQLTPRGELHNATIHGYSKNLRKNEKINASFDKGKIMKVAKKDYREALLKRLEKFDNNPKKAFTGKNSLDKNPIFYDIELTKKVPTKVDLVRYSVREKIYNKLNVDNVIDDQIKKILKDRIEEYGGDKEKAFSNLEEKPIWFNEDKGIAIKKVTVECFDKLIPIHSKKDNQGNYILDKKGNKQPVDYVRPDNNHHIAIFEDENGEYQERVVSFFEATANVLNGQPIIDTSYNKDKGWKFIFTLKKNEYFLLNNEEIGFNPKELSNEYILNPKNYSKLSPYLFRVQKISSKDYNFRHHLETSVNLKTKDKISEEEQNKINKKLKGITWERITSLSKLKSFVKVRINHIGQIVHVGEY